MERRIGLMRVHPAQAKLKFAKEKEKELEKTTEDLQLELVKIQEEVKLGTKR